MNSITVKFDYDKLKNFIRVVSSFPSDIDAIKDKYLVSAKSILGMLSIDFSDGITLKINSYDEDEIIRFFKEMEEFR